LVSKEKEFAKAGQQLQQLERLANNRGLARKAQADALAAAPPAPAAAGRPGSGSGAAGFGYLADEKARAEGWSLTGGQSVAQASDVGEMFRYVIATPVKLQRSQSAMLPIVNESVQGEKVSIYNEGSHPKHPLNGLKLKNSTELHLMQGPITVFDDNSYAGDAQIQDLPPGTERLISYAMDLDTEVAPVQKDDPRRLTSVKIAKGTLLTSHKYNRMKSYTVKNSGKRDKTVLIEYPIQQPWTLVEPKEPAEKTRSQYRFSVKAEPGKPSTLEIKEEYTQGEQVITNTTTDDRHFLNQPVRAKREEGPPRDDHSQSGHPASREQAPGAGATTRGDRPGAEADSRQHGPARQSGRALSPLRDQAHRAGRPERHPPQAGHGHDRRGAEAAEEPG
jgi:hypothetical protein